MAKASFPGVIDFNKEEIDIDYNQKSFTRANDFVDHEIADYNIDYNSEYQGFSEVSSNGGRSMTYGKDGLIDESSDESSDDEYDASSDDKDENVTLYHYTTEKGAQGISKDKMIKASIDKNNNAVFGEGVYFTAMDPYNNSKEDIIRNNFDDGTSVHKSNQFRNKADSAIEVSIPANEVNKIDSRRDVYLYKGNLNLDKYDHAVIENRMIGQNHDTQKLLEQLSYCRKLTDGLTQPRMRRFTGTWPKVLGLPLNLPSHLITSGPFNN